MLILRPYEYKLLLPQKRQEWRTPSLAQPKTVFGHENHQYWRLTARLSDGHIKWRGRFDDREDADAFVDALARFEILGTPVPRELWDLPTPSWFPGISEGVFYDFASPIVITSGTSQTSPSDWNNASNTIEGLGGGASGAAVNGTAHATGGGGAEYRKITNFSVATPGTTAFNYTIGPGGAALGSTAGASGNDGTQTTFNTSSLIANPGIHGVQGAGSQNGGAGGTGGTGAAGNHDGGRGGNLTGASGTGGSGGGGAGGSTGAGGSGVDDATTGTSLATNGGAADTGGTGAGTGGVAGATPNGGAGSEWDGTHGSGGGGGGSGSGGNAAGAGGNYGAGGGGHRSGANTGSGAGIQGMIWITYVPAGGSFQAAWAGRSVIIGGGIH